MVVDAFSLLSLYLCEITRSHHNYQHQEDENYHNIEAELAAHLNLVGDAATI